MKKIVLFAFSLVILAVITSCASTKTAISDFSPIAIIGVEGNPTVLSVDSNNEADEDAGGVLSNAINKVLDGKNPEIMSAQHRIDFAEETLKYLLEDLAGVEVLDREKVTDCDSYKHAKLNILSFMSTNIAATGYEDNMLSLGAKKARILMAETGAKGLISAEFEFDKRIEKKEAAAVVKMKIRMFDASGKNVVTHDFIAESAKRVKVHGLYSNKYDKEEFVELFKPTIETVIKKFIMEYL